MLYALNLGDEFNRDESATAITILANGQMLMGGQAQVGSNSAQLISFVYKLNPLNFAAVDPSFGTSGLIKLGAGYSYTPGEMLVQSDGNHPLAPPPSAAWPETCTSFALIPWIGYATGWPRVVPISISLPASLDFASPAPAEWTHHRCRTFASGPRNTT